MPLPGPKTVFTIYRRTEEDRDNMGEPEESWDAVTGESDIKVHFQPLSAYERAGLAQANPGQVLKSSHLFFLEKGTDIVADDRLHNEDTDNYYVVHSVEEWPTGHIEVIAGITNRQ